MRLLISLVFVWVLSGITPVLAIDNFETIGELRSACKVVMEDKQATEDVSFESGLCLGWRCGKFRTFPRKYLTAVRQPAMLYSLPRRGSLANSCTARRDFLCSWLFLSQKNPKRD